MAFPRPGGAPGTPRPHASFPAHHHARTRLWSGALLTLLLAGGCKERTSFDKVPTMGVQTCKVSVGDLRTNVLLRCGPACGGGDTPEGRCDVYHSVVICYAGDRVRSVRRMAPFKDQYRWCNWQGPEWKERGKRPPQGTKGTGTEGTGTQ